jgi:hypothetical protein
MILYNKLDSSDWASIYPSPLHTVPRRQDSWFLFSDAWFFIAKSLLIILRLIFCLTHHFMFSIYSFFEIFFLWSSCLQGYQILRYDTWSIFPWLRSSHKYWTKLIFNFLFIWVPCLTWYWFFNMKLFIGWLSMLIT